MEPAWVMPSPALPPMSTENESTRSLLLRQSRNGRRTRREPHAASGGHTHTPAGSTLGPRIAWPNDTADESGLRSLSVLLEQPWSPDSGGVVDRRVPEVIARRLLLAAHAQHRALVAPRQQAIDDAPHEDVVDAVHGDRGAVAAAEIPGVAHRPEATGEAQMDGLLLGPAPGERTAWFSKQGARRTRPGSPRRSCAFGQVRSYCRALRKWRQLWATLPQSPAYSSTTSLRWDGGHKRTGIVVSGAGIALRSIGIIGPAIADVVWADQVHG
jgi:hypothetical protein